jgi:MinD superfamily P-loop ATPase
VSFCPEAALKVVGGKARLISEELCDGLGGCARRCPNEAVIVEQRETAAFRSRLVGSAIRATIYEEQVDGPALLRERLSLCCQTTQCGRICERLTKQPGRVGVWCVDVAAGEKLNLYEALARPEFVCPKGVF